AGESTPRQYYRNIIHLRYAFNGSDWFEVTENATFTTDSSTDESRFNHIYKTTYTKNVNEVYTHPSGKVILHAGQWGSFFMHVIAGLSPAAGSEITIGGKATCSFRGPYSTVTTLGKVTYIFEGGSVTTIDDVFGNIYAKKTSPYQTMDVEIIPASDSLIFPTSDTYPMTASETTGKGTFTLHIQNNCFNIGYLLP
ncbi:MAG TPA: hypothetical protein DCY74_05520, partial [Clostridiales bacterium]|nr:hypothetical protein [Clostridiales bacterium]